MLEFLENGNNVAIIISVLILTIIYQKWKEIEDKRRNENEKEEMLSSHKIKLERTKRGQRSQIKGVATELMIPWMKEYTGCSGSELHYLGDPIDWIGFKGYDEVKKNPEAKVSIKLIEVKSGKARLSPGQKQIKKAVEEINQKDVIEFQHIHINHKEIEEQLEKLDIEIKD